MVGGIYEMKSRRIVPNYDSRVAVAMFDKIIEQFGVLEGMFIAASQMKRIPVDRRDISDMMLQELVRRSDEFEELLKNAGILKHYHGIGAFRWDAKMIYVYVYRTTLHKSR